MSALQDKKLKMPKIDLKKKPTYELLTLIGKQSAQDITPHPFTKLKKPKEEKIEQIFIKQSEKKKIIKKQIKKKFKKKS
tara:strand:- start:698 stop:934 length:237 start_codon:yes stop_codon:yes gene_type:complete